MAKTSYVGDRAARSGPGFAECPFNYGMKGTHMGFLGGWLSSNWEMGKGG